MVRARGGARRRRLGSLPDAQNARDRMRRGAPRRAETAVSPQLVRGRGYPDEPMFKLNRGELTRRFTQVFTQPLIEIGFVEAGAGQLYFNGQSHDLRAGDGYFLDMSTPHRHDPDGFMRNCYAHVKYEAMEALAPRDEYVRFIQPFLLLQSGATAPVMRAPGRFRELVLEAHERYHSGDPYAYALAWTKVVEAFVEIGRYCMQTIGAAQDGGIVRGRDTIARALEFIGENYSKPFALADVARYCRLSPSRLSAVFASVMHVSPIAYRNHLRINRAVGMLMSTARTVEEIAFECGFHSLAQFRTLIRRHTGRSPRSLRQQ
ncbi:MAG: helix-turn-helix domain-containing protein [Chitinivibrionales bacterium]|nr:helix-turn-helix domain-containing protein [Chitinivibrionales bacterium]